MRCFIWNTIQIVLALLGLALAFGGDRLSIPILFHAGIAFLGLFGVTVGSEAITTRRIVIGRRRHGTRRTYTGTPAILQGVQFNLIGLFLIAMTLLLQFKIDGRGLFLQIVRHPVVALVAFGMLVLMQAVIAIIGSRDVQDGSVLALLLLRLFPGSILAVIALALIGLGLFEIAAPDIFDQLGGGFLESLYGLR